MYCKECKVTVNCKTDVCPLCHGKLEGNPEKETRAFPKAKIRRFQPDWFGKIYFLIAAIITIVCLAVNLARNEKFLWSIIVLVSLVYGWYCIRFTIIAQGHFAARIFGQTIALTLLFIAVRLTVGGNHFIFITWLPVVYLCSEVLLFAYIAVNRRQARPIMMSIAVVAILGIIPVCAAFILDLSVKWPSIAVSAFSGAVFLTTLIIGRKHILGELKRYFHL